MNNHRDALLAARLEINLRRQAQRSNLHIDIVPDEAEMALSEAARNTAASLLDADARRSREISDALERIADGTYGECMDCDGEISERRLNAVPWAKRCRTCQEIADNWRAFESQMGDAA